MAGSQDDPRSVAAARTRSAAHDLAAAQSAAGVARTRLARVPAVTLPASRRLAGRRRQPRGELERRPRRWCDPAHGQRVAGRSDRLRDRREALPVARRARRGHGAVVDLPVGISDRDQRPADDRLERLAALAERLPQLLLGEGRKRAMAQRVEADVHAERDQRCEIFDTDAGVGAGPSRRYQATRAPQHPARRATCARRSRPTGRSRRALPPSSAARLPQRQASATRCSPRCRRRSLAPAAPTRTSAARAASLRSGRRSP
jgi:hypothetical protein